MNRVQFCLAAAFAGVLAGCGDGTQTLPPRPPEIREITAIPSSIVPGASLTAAVIAVDSEGKPLTYAWTANGGTFTDSTQASTTWNAPDSIGSYRLYAVVDNGSMTAVDSVDVLVGSGALEVTSYPPGVFIALNGVFTSFVTPHTFENLAIGEYTVSAAATEYQYEPASLTIFLSNGDADSLHFRVPLATFAELNLGRGDFEYVGPPEYLADGTGVLYSGTTTAMGSGLYSSGLAPETGAPNGLLLTTNIKIGEPVSVSGDGKWLIYTAADNRMSTCRIHDPNRDGVVDSLTDHTVLKTGGAYGIAAADDGRTAWSATPSEDAASSQILWGQTDSTEFSRIGVATTTVGRRPVWKPGESDFLAWEAAGAIYTAFVPESTPGSGVELTTPEGFNQWPAWGKWGKNHLAYINGPSELNAQNIYLQIRGTEYPVPVFTLLFDPTGLAWSPAQKQLAVSHNPGRGRILLVFDLPIP